MAGEEGTDLLLLGGTVDRLTEDLVVVGLRALRRPGQQLGLRQQAMASVDTLRTTQRNRDLIFYSATLPRFQFKMTIMVQA